jgi:small-conductance mechanosensitive channel
MIERFFDNEFLDIVIWGNYISDYIDAIIYFLFALLVLYLLQKFVMKKFAKFAKKTKTDIDDVLVEFIYSIKPRLYIILSIYIALRTLTLTDITQNIVNVILIVVVIFQITLSIQIVIEYITKKLSGDEEDEHAKSAAHILSTIAIITVWIFGILMILSNIGVNVGSLVAGVGIGGIAIAFAIKEVLADLFSSFAIYFDKPFKAGDNVKIGDDIGVVQKIGIKTTRIKSRTGEELVISNQDMTSARLHNFKRMDYRNAKFKFIVDLDTPSDVLEQIPGKIKEIVENVENTEFRRAHVKEFGDWGIVFESVHRIGTRDYNEFMDAQHEVNVKIKKMLEDMDVVLAHPEWRLLSKK